jgi:AraC-like DNA-binding protein
VDTSPRRLVALVPEPDRVGRLRAAFGDACDVAGSQAELIQKGRSTLVDAVVLSPFDGERRSLSTAVATIRASRHCPPIHVYTDRSVESVRELIALAHAGALSVIVAGVDDDPAHLRQLLRGATLEHAVNTVRGAAHASLHPRYAPLVARCLDRIADPPSAIDFARSLGVKRRTLTSWAESAGVRGIRSLTSRCRILVAIEMLREPQRSIESVAHELCFSSSAHLHNTIRRYTGLRPRQAAAKSALEWCETLLSAACARRPPPAETGVPPREWPVPPNADSLPTDQARPEE